MTPTDPPRKPRAFALDEPGVGFLQRPIVVPLIGQLEIDVPADGVEGVFTLCRRVE